MNRPPYWKRAIRRIARDTLASVKSRVAALFIATIGIGLAFLLNSYYLHLQTAKQLAIFAVVSLGGSYVVWFSAIWIFNTLRVPWLLDAESGKLIDECEKKAQTAETALADLRDRKEENRRHQKAFAELMQSGVNLSIDLTTYQAPTQFGAWDGRFAEWKAKVKKAISELGFDADAVAFTRAGDNAPPVAGIMNTGYFQETRLRILKQHEKELAAFVRLRLP